MSVRVSGLTECKVSISTHDTKTCWKLPNRLVSPTSDAAVADPHQVVSGSLVAWHQIVDLGVNSHFFAPCNQRTAFAKNVSQRQQFTHQRNRIALAKQTETSPTNKRASTPGYFASNFLQTSMAGSSWSWTHSKISYCKRERFQWLHSQSGDCSGHMTTPTAAQSYGSEGSPWGNREWKMSLGWTWGWGRHPSEVLAEKLLPAVQMAAWPLTSSCGGGDA